jgi:argininosuccinate lyase
MQEQDANMTYTSSIEYDHRLYKQDIAVSVAHSRMLAKQQIITNEDFRLINEGLISIKQEIESGEFPWRIELEDIHMNIETRLFEKIGESAGRLHTGRSRNDQIATDIRMYTKESILNTIKNIRSVQKALLDKANEFIEIVMPGYTHMQRAQPVLLPHHLLAYFHMFQRDIARMKNCFTRTDIMPLGSGALAGVPYPIDRQSVAKELGFSQISDNSMDAVSDRDFLLEYSGSASICMMHLSRLSEEIIIWSTQEFGFIRLSDEFTTGSSIMPQKRNPDFAELARGKTGRVYGNLMGLLTIMKGLPLTYNRDMQEDKEGFFDTVDTLNNTLAVFSDMIKTVSINSERTTQAVEDSNILATDLADYLVSKGETFRKAHGIVSKLVTIAHDQNIGLSELNLNDYSHLSQYLTSDINNITIQSSVINRNVHGGTNPEQVKESLHNALNILSEDNE